MANRDHSGTGEGFRVPGRGREIPDAADMAMLLNSIRGLVSTDPRLLRISRCATGIRFTPGIATPFLGQINPDNLAQISVGRNRGEAWYPYRDTITIGVDALHKSAAETVTISATSFVYYAITKSGATITATLTANATYPTQTTTTFYVVLGKALWDTDRVAKWFQYWYGDILVPAVIIDAEDCS